jgi:hypothetical protein
VFGRQQNKPDRVIVIADEAHTYANEDFCTAVELGRELNLCAILAHQHMGQLLAEGGSTRLLDAVKNCCKTRLVFGGNWKKDLEELTEDMMVDKYSPWALKDEITSLELEPVESMRKSYARGKAISRGRSWTRGETESESYGSGRQRNVTTTYGQSLSEGEGEGESQGETEGENEEETTGGSVQKGHNASQESGQSITHSRARSRGRTIAAGYGNSHGQSVSSHSTTGYSTMVSSNGDISTSSSDLAGVTEGDFEAGSEIYSESQSESTSQGRAFTKNRSRGRSESFGTAISWGNSKGKNKSKNRSKHREHNLSRSENWGEAEMEGASTSREEGISKNWTEGENDSQSRTQSVTESPFYEYIKRRPVTTRVYLTEQEQMTEFLKNIKAQPVGHFVLKVQGRTARFMKAPFVPTPQIPKARLEAARKKIFALPYYVKKADLSVGKNCTPPSHFLGDPDKNVKMNEIKKHERRSNEKPTGGLTLAKALKKTGDR